jgi:arginase
VQNLKRGIVTEAGAEVIWGDPDKKVNLAAEASLCKKDLSPTLVHLNLDILDESIGTVNGVESAEGLLEDDLMKCMEVLPEEATPASLTVCSFNPKLGDGDKIADIGVRAIVTFVKSLITA